jgi:L-arabinonolactonase
MAAELIQTVPVANVLGEGIVWNAHRQTAWWTDIQSSKLYEYDPVTESLKSWDTPYRVACFGFVEGSADLIVAFDQGIARFDVQSGRVGWLVQPGVLGDGIRFNDGRIDPAGRFWVGTMVENPDRATTAGSLYSLAPDSGLVEHVRDVGISNGLCWSPDGTRMYHADSAANVISVYRYDADRGATSDPRHFATTDPGVAPDGSTVDSDGGVWNAQWGGARVVRYTPDGDISQVIDLPVSQPTCTAFGGPDLDLLFVTSARDGLREGQLADQPLAGDLFIFRTGFKGLPAIDWRPASAD